MGAISLPYPVLPPILPFLFSPFFETLFFLSSSGLSKMDENRSRDLDAQDLSLHARFEHSPASAVTDWMLECDGDGKGAQTL